MLLILVVVGASLLGSFICSLCEASLFAVAPSRVEMLRTQSRGGKKLGELRDRIDDAIAGILTINTISHTLGAAYAGALVGETYGNRWLGVFAAAFTLAILFLSEIVPKSIGVAWVSELAPRIAWPVQIMVWSVWPLVKLTTLIMRLITHRAPGQQPTEEELLAMANMAAAEGEILPEESRWVKNSLRLNNVQARDLMTPRRAVLSLPADFPLSQINPRGEHWIHSRIPLTDERDPDRVVGVLHRRAVFDRLVDGNLSGTLRQLMRPPMIIRETTAGHQILEQLISQHQHLAAVVDSTGRLSGVLTLEDVLEYLIGRDIVAEHDAHPAMRRLAHERARFHADSEEPGAQT